MKLLHMADLHLGKRVYEFSMLEDQKYILQQTLDILEKEQVDGILLAGDIYDKTVPSAEAVQLFDDFLSKLAAREIAVFLINGNHDSAERLSFGAKIFSRNKVYFAAGYQGNVERITMEDAYGIVNVYLLPFAKPIYVKHAFPEQAEDITSYQDAMKVVMEHMELDTKERNVLVAHQFVTGALRCESEDISVGGMDNVDAALFEEFDYVALGHLHKSQTLRRGRIRYCGAPLVYSFDECAQEKSATLVNIGEKGSENAFEFIPFEPLHRCERIEGTLAELCAMPRSESYVQAVLTDKIRPLDPIGTLKLTYPNLLNLSFILPEAGDAWEPIAEFQPALDPLEHFIEFYTHQNKRAPSEEQLEILREVINEEGDAAL